MSETKKVTSGPWMVFHAPFEGATHGISSGNSSGTAVVFFGASKDDGIRNLADAELIAEAGAVHHETGLTPRQLLEQRDALVDALKTLLGVSVNPLYMPSTKADAEKQARAALALVKGEAK